MAGSRCFDPKTDAWAYELAGELTRDALTGLRLTDSVFHLECFRGADGQLVFGECAARTGGGMIVETVRAKFGVDLTESAVRIVVSESHPAVADPDPDIVGFTFLPSAPGMLTALNRPGMSGDSDRWEGWSHARAHFEEVPA